LSRFKYGYAFEALAPSPANSGGRRSTKLSTPSVEKGDKGDTDAFEDGGPIGHRSERSAAALDLGPTIR
jgi:hypothetical protein